MCICERTAASQPKSGNTAHRRSPLVKKGTPTTHNMQPPPPTRTSHATAAAAPVTSTAVAHPHPTKAAPCSNSTTTTTASAVRASITQQKQQLISFKQLSSILDPFYDTCSSALLHQSQRLAARKATTAARPATPAGGATVDAATTPCCCQLAPAAVVVEHSFLSQVGIGKAHEDGRSSPSMNCGALWDFISVGNSAWMDMIQDMEADKHEQLRSLEVSVV